MKRQDGYVMLLSVLVGGAICLSVALALLIGGADSQRGQLVVQQAAQARYSAEACAEESLQRIYDTSVKDESGSESSNNSSCTFTISSPNAKTRQINASGTVGPVVKKVQVYATIGVSNITIISWQEVTDF